MINIISYLCFSIEMNHNSLKKEKISKRMTLNKMKKIDEKNKKMEQEIKELIEKMEN